MKLLTPVEFPASRLGLSLGDKVMVLGSCFADAVGEHLKAAGFSVCLNPFGTLYNPASIAGAMQRMSSARPFSASECVEMGAGAGLVCSFSHHTRFARESVEDFLENANDSLDEAADFWQDCNKVIVTLGTIYCFLHEGSVVANCLKRPAAEFERVPMSLGQVLQTLRAMVVSAPGKDFIFTVSPVRHLADGAHGNMLSKSTLLLAVEQLLADPQVGSRCEYFPAYEIVMDELRDYRFYAPDMVHPSAQAEDYIWERFLAWAVPASEHAEIAANEKAFRASQHRPNLHK